MYLIKQHPEIFLFLVFLSLSFQITNGTSITVPGDFSTIDNAMSSSSTIDGDVLNITKGEYEMHDKIEK